MSATSRVPTDRSGELRVSVARRWRLRRAARADARAELPAVADPAHSTPRWTPTLAALVHEAEHGMAAELERLTEVLDPIDTGIAALHAALETAQVKAALDERAVLTPAHGSEIAQNLQRYAMATVERLRPLESRRASAVRNARAAGRRIRLHHEHLISIYLSVLVRRHPDGRELAHYWAVRAQATGHGGVIDEPEWFTEDP